MLVGGLIGLVLGALVCVLTYLGLVTIPTRYLFGVTSTLIALLAAGMAAQAIAFLEQADILTALDKTVWDTSWLLSDCKLPRPGLAYADRLCGPADRHATHRLCSDARRYRGTDEAFFRNASAAAASGIITRRSSLRDSLGLGEMIRAGRRRKNFAKIDQLGLQALDLETNGAAAGEGQRDGAGWRIVLGEFDRE